VELGVDGLTLGIDELEGVGTIAVHVAIAVGGAAIAEQEADLVSRLRAQGEEVPEHVRILKVCCRVALLCVNEAGKQDRVANEEDRCVVANQIPDAVIGVELDGKSSGIAGRIC